MLNLDSGSNFPINRFQYHLEEKKFSTEWIDDPKKKGRFCPRSKVEIAFDNNGVVKIQHFTQNRFQHLASSFLSLFGKKDVFKDEKSLYHYQPSQQILDKYKNKDIKQLNNDEYNALFKFFTLSQRTYTFDGLKSKIVTILETQNPTEEVAREAFKQPTSPARVELAATVVLPKTSPEIEKADEELKQRSQELKERLGEAKHRLDELKRHPTLEINTALEKALMDLEVIPTEKESLAQWEQKANKALKEVDDLEKGIEEHQQNLQAWLSASKEPSKTPVTEFEVKEEEREEKEFSGEPDLGQDLGEQTGDLFQAQQETIPKSEVEDKEGPKEEARLDKDLERQREAARRAEFIQNSKSLFQKQRDDLLQAQRETKDEVEVKEEPKEEIRLDKDLELRQKETERRNQLDQNAKRYIENFDHTLEHIQSIDPDIYQVLLTLRNDYEKLLASEKEYKALPGKDISREKSFNDDLEGLITQAQATFIQVQKASLRKVKEKKPEAIVTAAAMMQNAAVGMVGIMSTIATALAAQIAREVKAPETLTTTTTSETAEATVAGPEVEEPIAEQVVKESVTVEKEEIEEPIQLEDLALLFKEPSLEKPDLSLIPQDTRRGVIPKDTRGGVAAASVNLEALTTYLNAEKPKRGQTTLFAQFKNLYDNAVENNDFLKLQWLTLIVNNRLQSLKKPASSARLALTAPSEEAETALAAPSAQQLTAVQHEIDRRLLDLIKGNKGPGNWILSASEELEKAMPEFDVKTATPEELEVISASQDNAFQTLANELLRMTEMIKENVENKDKAFSDERENLETHLSVESPFDPVKDRILSIHDKVILEPSKPAFGKEDQIDVIAGEAFIRDEELAYAYEVNGALRDLAGSLYSLEERIKDAEKLVEGGKGVPYLTKLHEFDTETDIDAIETLDDIKTLDKELVAREAQLTSLIENARKAEQKRAEIAQHIDDFVKPLLEREKEKIKELETTFDVPFEGIEKALNKIEAEFNRQKEVYKAPGRFWGSTSKPVSELSLEELEDHSKAVDKRIHQEEVRFEKDPFKLDAALKATANFKETQRQLEGQIGTLSFTRGKEAGAYALKRANEREIKELNYYAKYYGTGTYLAGVVTAIEEATDRLKDKADQVGRQNEEMNLLKVLKQLPQPVEANMAKSNFLNDVNGQLSDYKQKIEKQADSFRMPIADDVTVQLFLNSFESLYKYVHDSVEHLLDEGSRAGANLSSLSGKNLIDYEKQALKAIQDGKDSLMPMLEVHDKAVEAQQKYSETIDTAQMQLERFKAQAKAEPPGQLFYIDQLQKGLEEAKNSREEFFSEKGRTLQNFPDIEEFATTLGHAREDLISILDNLEPSGLSLVEQLRASEENPGVLSDSSVSILRNGIRKAVSNDINTSLKFMDNYIKQIDQPPFGVYLPDKIKEKMQGTMEIQKEALEKLETEFHYKALVGNQWIKSQNNPSEDEMSAAHFELWQSSVAGKIKETEDSLESTFHINDLRETMKLYNDSLGEISKKIQEFRELEPPNLLAAQQLRKFFIEIGNNRQQLAQQITTPSGLKKYADFLRQESTEMQKKAGAEFKNLQLEEQLTKCEFGSTEYNKVLKKLTDQVKNDIIDYKNDLSWDTLPPQPLNYTKAWADKISDFVKQKEGVIGPYSSQYEVTSIPFPEIKPLERLTANEFLSYKKEVESLIAKGREDLEAMLPLQKVEDAKKTYDMVKGEVDDKLASLREEGKYALAADLQWALDDQASHLNAAATNINGTKAMHHFSQVAGDAVGKLEEALKDVTQREAELKAVRFVLTDAQQIDYLENHYRSDLDRLTKMDDYRDLKKSLLQDLISVRAREIMQKAGDLQQSLTRAINWRNDVYKEHEPIPQELVEEIAELKNIVSEIAPFNDELERIQETPPPKDWSDIEKYNKETEARLGEIQKSLDAINQKFIHHIKFEVPQKA